MPSGSSIHISIKPHGSVAGSRMMGTPATASRACSARTSLTWIQIITERPGGSAACPETSSKACLPEKEHYPGIFLLPELPVDGQAQHVAVEATARPKSLGRRRIRLLQNVHATISASR